MVKQSPFNLKEIFRDLLADHYIDLIDNQKTVEDFVKNTCGPEDPNDAVNYVKETVNHIKNGQAIYLERTRSTPAQATEFNHGNKTIAKMIDTTRTYSKGEKIFACFKYTPTWKKKWRGIRFMTEKEALDTYQVYNVGRLRFKNLDAADEFIKKLHGEEKNRRLLPGEEWAFGSGKTDDSNSIKTAYPVLESYLTYYTNKLFEDQKTVNKNSGKVVTVQEGAKHGLGLFNSGLLDKFASDIYIHGEITSKDIEAIKNCTIETSDSALSKLGFSSTPQTLVFFDNIDEIVYDSKIPIDLKNSEKLEHIIEENQNRFPEDFQSYIQKKQYYRVAVALRSATEGAEKIATRNYKYIVPQWRPTTKKIQFLMPIFLGLDYSKEPDFALVLGRDGNYYKPETILTLSMAYSNARLLCKPDNSWLRTEFIAESEEEDVDVET